jgi:hypothetical protein
MSTYDVNQCGGSVGDAVIDNTAAMQKTVNAALLLDPEQPSISTRDDALRVDVSNEIENTDGHNLRIGTG